MISILHHWGFKRNEDAAREYRTEIYSKTQTVQIPPPPPLEVDENGNVILPSWFTSRQKDIDEGKIDPYEGLGLGEEVVEDSQTDPSTATEPKIEVESHTVNGEENSPKDEL